MDDCNHVVVEVDTQREWSHVLDYYKVKRNGRRPQCNGMCIFINVHKFITGGKNYCGQGTKEAYLKNGTKNYNIITYEKWVGSLIKPVKVLRKHKI